VCGHNPDCDNLADKLVLSGTVVTIYTTCSTYLPTTVFMHFMFPESTATSGF